jgi:hypothetical protein
MAYPAYILARGRNVAREALLAEIIVAKLESLAEISTLEHTTLIDDFRRLGLSTPPFEEAAMQRLSLLQLEHMMSMADIRLAQLVPGTSFYGVIRDGTGGTGGNPYSAQIGELILADGTASWTVLLPDPTIIANEKCVVNVKMVTGTGPITVASVGGWPVDGMPSIDLPLLNITKTFHAVDGEYKIL